MKKSNRLSQAKKRKQKPSSKGGKRPLYDPKLGSSNWRKAQDGRFADHPVFRACRKLQGASVSLQRMMGSRKKMKLRLAATAEQMDEAFRVLKIEATSLNRRGAKLRFAEAVAAAFFDRKPEMRDEETLRVCQREIMMRTTTHEKPSQAELRHAVEEINGKKFTDERWKRLLKRIGLNKRLPTQREKTQGIRLRRYKASIRNE
jgi:hypothetical protein